MPSNVYHRKLDYKTITLHCDPSPGCMRKAQYKLKHIFYHEPPTNYKSGIILPFLTNLLRHLKQFPNSRQLVSLPIRFRHLSTPEVKEKL